MIPKYSVYEKYRITKNRRYFRETFTFPLVPIKEETDWVRLSGYVGKPEAARKNRGEQFFFVNGRYFKSPYLSRAVQEAFEGLLQPQYIPSYFLFLEIDPEKIDVNIHPQKRR